ncbi:MAG TPA: response regulator [Pirellulales bacterium]|nr:response regulator [Pirellulales bacterium]
MSFLSRFVDLQISKQLRSSGVDVHRRARQIVAFTLALIIWAPVFSVLYFAVHLPTLAISILLAAGLGLINLGLMRRFGSVMLSGNLMTLILYVLLAYLSVRSGGINSPAAAWFAVIPVLSTMMLGYRNGIVWLAATLAIMPVLFLEQRSTWPVTLSLDNHQLSIWGVASAVGITLVIYSLTLIYEHLKDAAVNSLLIANRTKSEFLANMSHEIRTPLTAILGYTDLLIEQDAEEGQDSACRAEKMATIKCAGEHLLTVVNDILDLSKIEAGKVQVEEVECDLPNLLSEVDSLMRPRAIGKGLAFEVRLTTAVPCRIRTDPTRLRQILLNLAGNAVKFTEHGYVEITTAVAGQGAEALLHIDIRDTGLGMTPEQTSWLFTPFNQADNSVTRRFGGTGLGLAICRRLAQLMGGMIALQHTLPGVGSVFRVELPLRAAPDAPWTAALKHIQTLAAVPLAPHRLQGRVLLAEDGPDNQLLIAFYLRKAGMDIEFANNGRVALEMLERTESGLPGVPRYDLLLTDIQMPEMDGYTLARILRKRGSAIPIIALTAHAMEEDRKKCLEAGCDDFLTKPVNKIQLLSMCTHWIGCKSNAAKNRQPVN